MKIVKDEDKVISSHIYDINVFEIVQSMNSYFKENFNLQEYESHKEDLKILYQSIIHKYKDSEVTESVNLKRKHLILPSTNDSYHIFLAYKLLTCDPYRIQAILSYHSVLFQGNSFASKGNFVGLVEYNIYNLVRSTDRKNEVIRLDKIATWLENNRRFELQKANTAKRVRFDEEFANILSDKLKVFVEDDSATWLFDSLFNDKYNGRKVVFNFEAIELCILLKKCIKNNVLYVKSNEILAKWICERFNVLKNKKEELNEETVLNYLNRNVEINYKKPRIYNKLFPDWNSKKD